MTERPFVGGADTAGGPTPGYYPDPSVPGFVRYWGGAAWVPGTSRPAPSDGEVLEPPRFVARQSAPVPGRYVPPPAVAGAAAAAAPAAPAKAATATAETASLASWLGSDPLESPGSATGTGPVYFDQTSAGASFTFVPGADLEAYAALEAGLEVGPEAEAGLEPEATQPPTAQDGARQAATGWQADPRAQRGLLESEEAPRWVSWGMLPAGPVAPADPAPAPIVAPPVARVPAPASAPAAVASAPVASAAVAAEPVAAEPVSAVVGAPAAVSAPAARPTPRKAAARKSAPLPAAGLGRRLFARLIDSAVLAVVAVGAGLPLLSSAVEHLQLKLDQARAASELTGRETRVWMIDPVVLGKVGVLLGVLLLVGILYEVLPTARTGQTFGKRLAGVRVVDSRRPGRNAEPPALGRSALRWLVRQLSMLALVGLLWPLFDRRARRGWQDRAARTRVVRA